MSVSAAPAKLQVPGNKGGVPRIRGAPGSMKRWLLLAAVVALGIAVWNPLLPGHGRTQELLVIIDITQSMAVTDRILMRPDGGAKTVSRLDYAKEMLRQHLRDMQCGNRVGWGVFTAHRSFVLMAPVEVCGNFEELLRTLTHIDYRMAWTGNSEVAKGIDSALITGREMGSKPTVVFVTDGQEAPPVNARFRPGFHGEKGSVPGLLVGVGGPNLSPIPKINLEGRAVGVWRAKEVLQTDPRNADRESGIAASPMADATPGREHLSALRDDYLKLLAEETGLGYVTLEGAESLKAALGRSELSRTSTASLSMRQPLCVLTLFILCVAYWPSACHRARKSG